jgi:putative ABC transport system permease protein
MKKLWTALCVAPLLLAGLVAALAALLPAMQAYRTDVADLLVQP